MYTVTVRSQFAAAHFLRCYQGAPEPLHGHNFKVEVVLSGADTGPGGMLIDFLWVRERLQEVLGGLEHTCLNDLPAFASAEPSAEHVARHIHRAMAPGLPDGVELQSVTVWETEQFGATYRPQ